MGTQRCCLLVILVAAALVFGLEEAKASKYGTEDIERLLLDMETWDPEETFTERLNFILLELWWSPVQDSVATDATCPDLKQNLARDGRLMLVQCNTMQLNKNYENSALIVSTGVASLQLVVQKLVAFTNPREASVLVKVSNENYALIKFSQGHCADVYRIFNLGFNLSLELLSKVTDVLTTTQEQADLHWEILLNANKTAIYLHCRVRVSNGWRCSNNTESPAPHATAQLVRVRRQADGGGSSGADSSGGDSTGGGSSGGGSSGSGSSGGGSSGGGSSGGGSLGDGLSGGGSSGGDSSAGGSSGGASSGGASAGGDSFGGGSSGGGSSGGGASSGGPSDGGSSGGGASGGGASGGDPFSGGASGGGVSGGGASGVGASGGGPTGGGASGGVPPGADASGGGATGGGASGGGASSGGPSSRGRSGGSASAGGALDGDLSGGSLSGGASSGDGLSGGGVSGGGSSSGGSSGGGSPGGGSSGSGSSGAGVSGGASSGGGASGGSASGGGASGVGSSSGGASGVSSSGLGVSSGGSPGTDLGSPDGALTPSAGSTGGDLGSPGGVLAPPSGSSGGDSGSTGGALVPPAGSDSGSPGGVLVPPSGSSAGDSGSPGGASVPPAGSDSGSLDGAVSPPPGSSGTDSSTSPESGRDLVLPPDSLPSGPSTDSPAASLGEKFNCPYLTVITRRKFTILLSITDLATKVQLDGLTDEQVVNRVDRALHEAFKSSRFALSGRYNPLVNRILLGRSHLMMLVTVEKDQKLRPRRSGAKFELPPTFLSGLATVWRIDIPRSAFNSVEVKIPIRDICDIYEEIITCPYVVENKERIKLHMTIDLSPFYSRELLADKSRLNESVEVLVHHLLENGNHYHTKHHPNNTFELEVLGQKVVVSAQLDLWIKSRHERHPNSTELETQFLHNLDHYMETHSAGDVFFLRLSGLRVTVLPIIVACMDYLKEVPYKDKKYFSYSASLRVRSPQSHLREKSVYFRAMCETSLLHRLPFLSVGRNQSAVPHEYHNMVLLSNVTFARDKDEAVLVLRAMFRVNTEQPKAAVEAAFSQFIRKDEGFHRWLGVATETASVQSDEKPILRTVRHKYKKYFGQSRRLLVTKLRFAKYLKRLCSAWFSQQIIQKAYYYTSRAYYTVDQERDFDLDHSDEAACRSQNSMEFTAVYTLSSLADPTHAWKKGLLDAELLEGLKFIFPELEVTVLQTSINPANVRFDRMRRRVQQLVSLTALPAMLAAGGRPKSSSWAANYAKAGLRLWLATGYLQVNPEERVFSIEGAINVTDIVSDASGIAFKASYLLKSYREATWSSEHLARLFRLGFVSREYRLDATQIRLNRVAERPLFVARSAEGCLDTGANATIVHHREALLLSTEDLRHWQKRNESQLRADVAELIRRCYRHGEDAKLTASGFRQAAPDSVEGATFLNLDAQIVDNQLLFRTQYAIETASPVAFEPSAAHAIGEFRTGLLAHASRLHIQGPALEVCDDCSLEVTCQPRMDQLQRQAYSVRHFIHLLQARVSSRVWRAAGDSVSVPQLLSHWLKVLYLDYFRDSLRLDSRPPVYAYIPFDSDIPVEIDEAGRLITMNYILIRDSETIDTGFKNKLLWQEEDFARSFLEAFRAFNEVTGVFSIDLEPQTDIEYYPLIPKKEPTMVVSSVTKEVIVNIKGLSSEKCTDSLFKQKLHSLSTAKYKMVSGSKVEATPVPDGCDVRFLICAVDPTNVDTNTWTVDQLRQYLHPALKGEFDKFTVATADKTTRCIYCDRKRRIFVNIEADYNTPAQFAGVEFLTVKNYAEKRRHLIEDHLVPAFDPARRSQMFMGRRHYQLENLATAQFDFRKVGERERYSVIFDASIVPSDASWSEYHLRKLFTGWMSSQNAKARDVQLSNIDVQILDPVEMSEYIPPPKTDVYTAMLNLSVPIYATGSGEPIQQLISDAFHQGNKVFNVNIQKYSKANSPGTSYSPPGETLDDGSKRLRAKLENCSVVMRIQLPQLLTRTSLLRQLQAGFSQLPDGSLKDRLDIDFSQADADLYYNSTALSKTDCSQTSRRVKFLMMLNLLNTRGNRAIANVSSSANFTFKVDMVNGIKKLVEHNVLDYYGLDISITGDKEVEIMYRSTDKTGVVQVDYNLVSVIPGFKWIKFVRDTNDILNRISLRTSYDGHRYHDVMKSIGYVQFHGVPTTHVYDRCSFSKHFRVLQTTHFTIKDRDLFQRLGFYLNPVAAVKQLVNIPYTMKLSGMQIYSIVADSTALHKHNIEGDISLTFSASYSLIAAHRFNIAEYILDIFIRQMVESISDAYGLTLIGNNITMLDVKQGGVHCVAKIVSSSAEQLTTERVGCYPVLDASLTVGVCAKSNPHISRQVPIKHNFALLVESNFVFGDVFPQNDPEARAMIEYLLALTFDDRITPGIHLTWDPTFSGQTSMHVAFTGAGLRLKVETYYILLKSKAMTRNVTAAMVGEIFNSNIRKVLGYFGNGTIERSIIQIWSPDCALINSGMGTGSPIGPVATRPVAPVTPRPGHDYLGRTGIATIHLAVSMYKNFEVASLTAEASYARFTFSKWVRQVFDRLPAYRLLNPAFSNLLTSIEAPSPTQTVLRFNNLRVDLGSTRTPAQTLADSFAEQALRRSNRFIVSASVLSNLRVKAEFAVAATLRRRRRAVEQQQQQQKHQAVRCPPGAQGYSQLYLTLSLKSRYHLWFSHQYRAKSVLAYLLKRSVMEAVNAAGFNITLAKSQVQLSYLSDTRRAVAFMATVRDLCPPAGAVSGPTELRRRFYASWTGHSVAGRLLQEQLVGLSWQAGRADGTVTGWRLRVYKSLLLDHWPWSDSFTDRQSLQRLRLTAKLLGILQLVYNQPELLALRGFDFDVQRTEAGVRIFLFECLVMSGGALNSTDALSAEAAVRSVNLRREAEIRKATPLLMSPFNMTDLFIKVLHIEALSTTEVAAQQQQQRKTLMASFQPQQAAAADSDLAWIEQVEAAMRRVPGTPQQPQVRVFRQSPIASGGADPLQPKGPQRSVITVLTSVQGNATSQKQYRAGVAKILGSLGTDVATEFLFSDIELHFDTSRRLPQGASYFLINHTAVDECDEALAPRERHRVSPQRLAEFWTNMLLHIVHSEVHSLAVAPLKAVASWSSTGTRLINFHYQIAMHSDRWSVEAVQQYISDRFDLWNLLFPYSNIRTINIDAKQSSYRWWKQSTQVYNAGSTEAPITTSTRAAGTTEATTDATTESSAAAATTKTTATTTAAAITTTAAATTTATTTTAERHADIQHCGR